MGLIDLAAAKAHLRVDDDYPAGQVEPYLLAAEDSAQDYLNRKLYSDDAALGAARAPLAQAVAAASAAWASAQESAAAIEDADVREWTLAQARQARALTLEEVRQIADGLVLNDAIRGAILLTMGHLHEHREDAVVGAAATELPHGARWLLAPYRIAMGV